MWYFVEYIDIRSMEAFEKLELCVKKEIEFLTIQEK